MKKIKVALIAVAVAVSGAFAPAFAAPSVEQVKQFVQSQPTDTDPRVVGAQEAFGLASMNYAMDKLSDELNETEKQIDKIFEAPDLAQSLQQTIQSVIPASTFEGITTEEELQAKLEELVQQDPQLEAKLMNAYRQNKYIKQLIPLFFANQDQYQANVIDQNTFDELVVAFTNMTLAMQQMMQEQQAE